MRSYTVTIAVIFLIAASLGLVSMAEAPVPAGVPPETKDPPETELAKLIQYPLRLADNAFPDRRSLTLAEIKRYEDFVAKNQDPKLAATAKLMIMRLYLDVIKPEIYPLRKREFDCWKPTATTMAAEKCSIAAKKELAEVGSWNDPLYIKKAEELAEKLVLQYGRRRPVYRWDSNHFSEWNNEESGAWVLFWLAEGASKTQKYILYKRILEEKYQISATIEMEIKEFIGAFDKKK